MKFTKETMPTLTETKEQKTYNAINKLFTMTIYPLFNKFNPTPHSL